MRAARAALALALVLAACKPAPKPGPGGALVLTTQDGCPSLIALDADHVYFATTAGVLANVPKAGGKKTVLAEGLVRPGALAVDDSGAYVGTQGALVKVAKEGGAPVTLASKLGLVTGLALDATHVTFADFVKDSTLARVPKAGGDVDRLQSVPGLVGHIATDDASIWFVASHQLVKLPKLGGFRAALDVTAEGDVRGADARAVFLVDGRTIMRADKATGKTERVAEALVVPDPFIDDKEVFWPDAKTSGEGPSRVMSAPSSGGRPREIAADQPVPKAIAADAHDVYWVSCGRDGAAGSVSKKAR